MYNKKRKYYKGNNEYNSILLNREELILNIKKIKKEIGLKVINNEINKILIHQLESQYQHYYDIKNKEFVF